MKYLLTVLMAATPLVAVGQGGKLSIEHLKKNDPNVLYFTLFFDDDCPGTQSSYEETVEGELLRARIKPKSGWSYNETFLHTDVSCTNPDNRVVAYDISVHFGEFQRVSAPAPNELEFHMILHAKPYGAFGFRSVYSTEEIERDLKSSLRESVSEALTDYLRANFTD